jgi:hypothetical protein
VPISIVAGTGGDIDLLSFDASAVRRGRERLNDFGSMQEDYRAQPVANSNMSHTCHAHGCTTPVPPKMFMCKPHWAKLRKRTQAAIWAEYTDGQEVTKTPTLRYLAVQQYAIGESAFRPHDEAAARVAAEYIAKAMQFRALAIEAGEGDPLGWVRVGLTDAESKAALHPNGACTCAGEGHCDWCSRIAPCGHKYSECPGCGDEDDEPGTTMKILSVWPPWAQLIFFGKDVENRGRAWAWRGLVAIHASKNNHTMSECADILVELVARGMISMEIARQVADRIANDRGKVIGVVRLAGCKTSSSSPWWVEGQVALELADQRLLETPIPHRGEQGPRPYVLPASAKLLPAAPAPQLELPTLLDVDQAIDDWGANCGPAALAGALGLQLADVRDAVSEDGSFRGYMSITNMKTALARLRVVPERVWTSPPNGMLAKTDGSPILCCIAWGGPWSVVPRAAAKHRHFIVYRYGFVGSVGPGWVCDVNVDGGWILASEWKSQLLPQLLPERGDGTWAIQWAAQVRLPA